MEKIIIKVPGQYRYMGEWNEFIDLFPRFPHIMDKQVPGCGFTDWCLTNPDNVILCSPRNMLILNKWEQHPDDVFRVHNDKYDIDPGVDRDLNNDAKEKGEVETFIQTLERLSKEEKESFTSQLFRDLDNYFKRMDSCKKPYKILVTYDSFRILKDVLKELDNFNTFQIIVDEFQTIFTDSRFKSDTELEFVINGYYFHIVNPDVAYSLKSTHKPLYAHIQIDTSGTLDELNGVDTNGEYTGVLFDDVKGTTANDLYIYDAEGNVPEESKRGTGAETDPITEIHCKNL